MCTGKQDEHKAILSFRPWSMLWTLHKASFPAVWFCRKRLIGLWFWTNCQALPMFSHLRFSGAHWATTGLIICVIRVWLQNKFWIQSLQFFRVRSLNMLWVRAEPRARTWSMHAQLVQQWAAGTLQCPVALRHLCSLLCSPFQLLSLSNSMPQLYFCLLSPLLCLSTERNYGLHFFNLCLGVCFFLWCQTMGSFLSVPIYENWKPDFWFLFDLCHLSVLQSSPLCPGVLPGLDTSSQQHWIKNKMKGKELHPCTRELLPFPQEDILGATLLLPLSTSPCKVSHVVMMKRLQCSKATLAHVPQLQKQTKALVMAWLMEKISLCKMAFLPLA